MIPTFFREETYRQVILVELYKHTRKKKISKEIEALRGNVLHG